MKNWQFGIKSVIDQHNTKKLFIAFEGNPISSIEPERVLSEAASFVTKTRARLGDDCVFFKKYYDINKAEK